MVPVRLGSLVLFIGSIICSPVVAETPVDVGDRRELFVDRHLIGELNGSARRQLHRPEPEGVAITFDEPWEGNVSGYHSVFRDGDRYRMYYRGWQLELKENGHRTVHEPVLCYAVSEDGVNWEKPDLGLFSFNGSKDNNIVLTKDAFADLSDDPGHAAVFKDRNPDAAGNARYKAIVRSRDPSGLLAFRSPDGIHWTPMQREPVITDGAFDSQNLAFWDSDDRTYRAYFRDFRDGRRAIKTATSDDFLTWTEPEWLTYPDAPDEQLYTNQVKPYFRAPHILLGFPTRYLERQWDDSMKQLPEPEHRRRRTSSSRRFGTALTDVLLMSSRDGRVFHRWKEAFLRPGPHRPGSWAYGDHYLAWQLVRTASPMNGAPDRISMYASEGYWTGDSNRLRHYSLRMDGFVSVTAPRDGGTLITKPLLFDGNRLTLNVSTSAAGTVKVGLLNQEGEPINGLSTGSCSPIYGDSIDYVVRWQSDVNLSDYAGEVVRLRFELKDADLYSFRFE